MLKDCSICYLVTFNEDFFSLYYQTEMKEKFYSNLKHNVSVLINHCSIHYLSFAFKKIMNFCFNFLKFNMTLTNIIAAYFINLYCMI